MATERLPFFPGNRRKVKLEDWDPLMNAQSEKRIRLDLLMPLTGESVIGIPDWISPVWEQMEVEGSKTKDSDFEVEIEGTTFEGFSTEGSKRPIETEAHGLDLTREELGSRHVSVPGSTLRNFKLMRVTQDKQSLVCLKFSLTAKADAGLVLWAYKYHDATFWAAFTQQEPVVNLGKPADAQMQLTEQKQTPAEAKRVAQEFFTKSAQKAVKEQPLKEQEAELATAKKPN